MGGSLGALIGSYAPVAVSASYDSIATLSGNGSASQLTFSSIPSTYTHLQVRLIARGVRSFASEQLYIRLNGDGGSNYAYHYLYGDESAGPQVSGQTSTSTFFVAEMPAANETTNLYSSHIVDVLDYTNTNKNTTMRSWSGYDNATSSANSGKIWLGSSVWMNTSAVTSLTVLSNGAFATNTRIALYGIKG